MDSGKLALVDRLFHSTLERPAAEREAFIRQACAGDCALESELLSLVRAQQDAGSFLGEPAIHVAARALAADRLIGHTFSHYRILEKLGEGGMGVVYKAEDTRLLRFVALKFLPDEVTGGSSTLARFQHEARAASALNHPNICTIHDVGQQDGRTFIVMEYLAGGTLKDLIAGTPVEPGKLQAWAIAICEALQAAHTGNIIHRDIKPANIFITRNGGVKVLDFGLAKTSSFAGLKGATDTGAGSRTLDIELTGAGSAAGTAPYMSPEQIRAEVLDTRTDLFSLGAVLYEMATGKRAFAADTHRACFDSILNATPVPARELNPALPAQLERIIVRCLRKDRSLRYQSAADIASDLRALGTPAKRRQSWVVAAAVLTAAAAVAGFFALRKPAPRLTERDTVVLADFRNATRDPVFDSALRQAVSTELGQSPFLTMLDDQKIQATLALMRKPADTKLTPQVARDVCRRVGSAAVIEGSVDSVGSGYLLGLTARNCRSGDPFYSGQIEATGKEQVIGVLRKMSARLRERAGESLASIRQYSNPLEEATTPSLEALTAFSEGQSAISKGPRAALELFRRAVEIDPNFASANAFLGLMYSSLGDAANASRYARKAYDLRGRANERERYFIELMYQLRALGNLEQARETAELWAQRYPRDPKVESLLAGSILESTGRYEEAEPHGRKAIQIDPDNAYGYHNLANSFICRGRLNEASAVLDAAVARRLDIHEFNALRFQIAFLKDDLPEMTRIASIAEGKLGASDWVFDIEAGALAYRGRLRDSRLKTQRAVSIAGATGRTFAVAQHQAASAVREFLFGNPAQARRAAEAALASGAGDRESVAGAALTLAFLRDPKAAALIAAEDRRFPQDTTVQASFLPALRAQLALNRGEPARALALLQPNVPYEFGWLGPQTAGFSMSLYPLYMRGKAYRALGRPAEAAAEFRKIIDHLGVVSNEPTIAAPARLELARAFEAQGDHAAAARVYEEFLNIWRDADQDIPLFIAARNEYATATRRL